MVLLRNRNHNTRTFRAVPDRILQQIVPDEFQVFGIGLDGWVVFRPDFDRYSTCDGEGSKAIGALLTGNRQIDGDQILSMMASGRLFRTRQTQHGMNELLDASNIFERDLDTRPVFVRSARHLHQRLQSGFQNSHRRFQFVRRVREKFLLRSECAVQASQAWSPSHASAEPVLRSRLRLLEV